MTDDNAIYVSPDIWKEGREAGPLAIGALIACACASSIAGLKGIVPKVRVKEWCLLGEEVQGIDEAAAALTAAGFWIDEGEHYRISGEHIRFERPRPPEGFVRFSEDDPEVQGG